MKKVLICASMLAAAGQAHAFNYNTVSVHYEAGTVFSDTPEVGDMTVTGVRVFGSLDLQAGFGVYAHAMSGTGETTMSDYYGVYDVELELDANGLGLFYHRPISRATDILVMVGRYNTDMELIVDGMSLGSESGSGSEYGLGVKSMVAPSVELNGTFSQTSFEGESSSFVDIGGALYFSRQVKAFATYERETNGDSHFGQFGVALHF